MILMFVGGLVRLMYFFSKNKLGLFIDVMAVTTLWERFK
jgi:hypothetical protein